MRCLLILLLLSVCGATAAQGIRKSAFVYDTSGFYLHGKPFRIWSGEMHFQRIPRIYWRDRLLKAKAMGLNTVATYVFWNALEPRPGQWDFSGNNDLAAFLRLAQDVGLYVFIRPGPYACAEWDFGGLPAWLLAKPGVKVRCSDPDYLRAALKYVRKLAAVIAPFQVNRGGNVLMLQVENEYGSFGNDRAYLTALRDAWRAGDIRIPLSTGDGATPYMLEAGACPDAWLALIPAQMPAILRRPSVPDRMYRLFVLNIIRVGLPIGGKNGSASIR